MLYPRGPQECRPNAIECLEVINDSFETLNVIKDAVAYQAACYPSLRFTHKAHCKSEFVSSKSQRIHGDHQGILTVRIGGSLGVILSTTHITSRKHLNALRML